MKPLVLIGAGGHGRVVADIASALGRTEILFLDDGRPDRASNGDWPIVGAVGNWSRFGRDADFFVAVGDNRARFRLAQEIENKTEQKLVSIIHPSAQISPRAAIGGGSVLMAGVVVEAFSKVGRYCIINSGASVNHDCELADAVHISPGCHLAGNVKVGARTWIGIGAVARQGAIIGSDSTVGAGATIIEDVQSDVTVFGTPARQKFS